MGKAVEAWVRLIPSIVGVDDQGATTLVNAHAEALLGYEAAGLIGRRIEILVPEGLQPRASRAPRWLRRRSRGAPQAPGATYPCSARTGPSCRWRSPWFRRGNDGPLVIATIIDLSKRQRAEAELRRLAGQQAAVARLEEAATAHMATAPPSTSSPPAARACG